MGKLFTKAVKTQRKLKACLFGTSGSGKTYTGLSLLTHMLPKGGKIAVIDTERGSASLYAGEGLFEFDTVSIDSYRVKDYIEAIEMAAAEGYQALLIDSLSHAWEGKGGILERVDEIAKQKSYRDGMRAWNDVKPEEDRLWAAILDCPMHVIVTMRSKTAYEMSKDEKTGKLKIEKLGMAPIQRANKEYEFDVVARMDTDNNLIVDKSRCIALRDKPVWSMPGKELAYLLRDWLCDGEEAKDNAKAAVVLKEKQDLWGAVRAFVETNKEHNFVTESAFTERLSKEADKSIEHMESVIKSTMDEMLIAIENQNQGE